MLDEPQISIYFFSEFDGTKAVGEFELMNLINQCVTAISLEWPLDVRVNLA